MCISACRNIKCNKCVPFGSISAFHYIFLKNLHYHNKKQNSLNKIINIHSYTLMPQYFFIWFCPWSDIRNNHLFLCVDHGLWTPGEEIGFTERPKIHSHSLIFRYGRSIFWLPHRPKFSDFFDLCLHWVSVVRGLE